jgi:hypothetical protein
MSTTTSPVAGKIGQALKFDGSTSYVDFGPAPYLDGLSGVTMSVWYITASTTNQPLINTWFGGLLLYTQQFALVPQGGSFTSATMSAITGQWVHLVGVYDGTQSLLYRNGTLVSTGIATSGVTPTAVGNLTLGRKSAAQPLIFFDGKVDDARVYNRALSAAEVKQLYKLGTANVAHSNTVALSNGLVGYWTFDGSATNWRTNTTADLSGNGNTGTLVGMSTSSSPVAGKIGQALYFTGTPGSYSAIRMGNKSAFEPAQFTISAWINSGTDQSTAIVSKGAGDSAGSGYGLYYYSNNSFQFRLDGAPITSANNSLPLNKWNHVTATYDGQQMVIYINGSSAATPVAKVGATVSSSYEFAVGDRALYAWPDPSNTPFINGRIDDVRVYNRALTAGEVKQLDHMGQP